MQYVLTYFDEVKTDVIEAKNWYKFKLNGLEKRFAKSVEETLLQIQNTPTRFSVRYKNIRIAYTKTFPYAIHFYINDNTIVITAIIHTSRGPRITFNRI